MVGVPGKYKVSKTGSLVWLREIRPLPDLYAIANTQEGLQYLQVSIKMTRQVGKVLTMVSSCLEHDE